MTELTVTIKYKGEKVELPLRAYNYGHTYRIAIKVSDEELIFEPDEERNLRAFAPEHIDNALIAIIAAELEKSRS